jgi:hypothetical protein
LPIARDTVGVEITIIAEGARAATCAGGPYNPPSMSPSRSANADDNARRATRALRHAAQAVPFAAAAVLLLFLGLAFFAQPADDDFCYAARVRDIGYAAAQAEWYRGWSGRFVATGAISAFAAAGDLLALYPLAAVLVLVSTLAAFLVLVASVQTAGTSRSATAVAAAVLTILFIAGTPDLAQTFYWLSGSFTYQLGNVAIVLLAASLVRRERLGRDAGPSGAVLFAAACACAVAAVGSNEVALVLVVLGIGTGSAVAWHLHRPARWFWSGVLVVACAAAFVSLFAPGNAVRAGGIGGDGMLRLPGVFAALALLPWVALRALYWLAQPALWAAALIVLAATLPVCRRVLAPNGHFDARFYAVPAIWVLAILVSSAIGFAVNRYPLPERAESVVYLAFLLGWFPSFVVLAHGIFGARLERWAPA